MHAVGGDQIVGAHRLRCARFLIAYDRVDAPFVLFERAELRVVAHLAVVPTAMREQDRFECALRTVLPARLGAEIFERREDRSTSKA